MPPTPTSQRRSIGLLGGSFNPPHAGHREISLAALDRLGLDEVWWLVTPGNPLKQRNTYAPYDERFDAAQRLSAHAKIIVSDFERQHDLQYTADTLKVLRKEYLHTDFIWLMGADGLANFHRWKDWRVIAQTVPMAIFNRPGHGEAALASEAGKALSAARLDAGQAATLCAREPPAWIFFADTHNPISSTQLRAGTIQNTKPVIDPTDLEAPCGALAFFLDLHPDLGDFRADAIEGLSQAKKSVSPKYFYDERGSKLFDQITTLDEYYPTRTERGVFLDNAGEITDAIGPGAAVFEYGSGSSEKIEWLVNGLMRPGAYVAMDISRDHLLASASALARDFDIPVAAICADFHAPIVMPEGVIDPPSHWLGYFPGSTIGNMWPETAVAFMTRAAATLGPGAQFLIGVDLEKDTPVLEAAYNDAQGVTAAFNLNLLARMQRELGAELNIDDFEHYAYYNDAKSRIEMHLRALRSTAISIDGRRFSFAAGETLHTENSHKYTIEKFGKLVNQTPWRLEKAWTDPKGWFGACLLSNS